MSLKLPPGVFGVDRKPSPAGANIPAGGIHAFHVVRYDARIKKGTPAYDAIEAWVRVYTRSIGQTEAVTMSPELQP